MKDRIRQIMEYENMSQQEFSNRLGISPASLSSIFNGRSRPTNNHVQAIHHAFPEISISWLLFGEGTMFEDDMPDPLEVADVQDLGASEPSNQGDAPAADMFNTRPQTAAVKHPIAPVMSQNLGATPAYSKYHRDNMADMRAQERAMRKIKEIRVFYDDGTYESFAPSK